MLWTTANLRVTAYKTATNPSGTKSFVSFKQEFRKHVLYCTINISPAVQWLVFIFVIVNRVKDRWTQSHPYDVSMVMCRRRLRAETRLTYVSTLGLLSHSCVSCWSKLGDSSMDPEIFPGQLQLGMDLQPKLSLRRQLVGLSPKYNDLGLGRDMAWYVCPWGLLVNSFNWGGFVKISIVIFSFFFFF